MLVLPASRVASKPAYESSYAGEAACARAGARMPETKEVAEHEAREPSSAKRPSLSCRRHLSSTARKGARTRPKRLLLSKQSLGGDDKAKRKRWRRRRDGLKRRGTSKRKRSQRVTREPKLQKSSYAGERYSLEYGGKPTGSSDNGGPQAVTNLACRHTRPYLYRYPARFAFVSFIHTVALSPFPHTRAMSQLALSS